MDTVKKTSSPPSLLRWMKNRYENDEEYRKKQIANAKAKYQLKKQEIKERYENDLEYRQKIQERTRINNERVKEMRRLKKLSNTANSE